MHEAAPLVSGASGATTDTARWFFHAACGVGRRGCAGPCVCGPEAYALRVDLRSVAGGKVCWLACRPAAPECSCMLSQGLPYLTMLACPVCLACVLASCNWRCCLGAVGWRPCAWSCCLRAVSQASRGRGQAAPLQRGMPMSLPVGSCHCPGQELPVKQSRACACEQGQGQGQGLAGCVGFVGLLSKIYLLAAKISIAQKSKLPVFLVAHRCDSGDSGDRSSCHATCWCSAMHT